MTDVRIIDAEAIGRIMENGRPAGLWAARQDAKRMIWAAADADGTKCLRVWGTFPEILKWLDFRAGIKAGETRDVLAERTRGVRVNADPGIRIPGAQIEEWRWDDVIPEEFFAGRGRGITVAPPKEKKVYKHKVRQSTIENRERRRREDMKIMQMKARGETTRAIAEEIGLSPSAILRRIASIRRKGGML